MQRYNDRGIDPGQLLVRNDTFPPRMHGVRKGRLPAIGADRIISATRNALPVVSTEVARFEITGIRARARMTREV